MGFVSLSYVCGAAYLHGILSRSALLVPREDNMFGCIIMSVYYFSFNGQMDKGILTDEKMRRSLERSGRIKDENEVDDDNYILINGRLLSPP